MPTVREEVRDRENIISYARAVLQATGMVLQKSAEGYDSLINPSRGANPIAYAIYKTIRYLAQVNETARSLAEKMYFGLDRDRQRGFPFVPLPLTADIKIEERDLVHYGLTLDTVIDGMRVYGADVIKTLSFELKKRMRDKNFRLLFWLFSDLEGREHIGQFYRELPPVKKPIFIDTAISGRAVSTILQGLSSNGHHVYPIVFVDGNGGRLNRIHKEYLQQRQHRGELELVNMRRIASEDQGAAFLGVYAGFYPQIMFGARELSLPNTSAVTWYYLNEDQRKSNIPYRETFDSFMNLITTATQMVADMARQWGEGFERLEDSDILQLLDEDKEKSQTLQRAIDDLDAEIVEHGMPRVEPSVTIKEDFRMPIERAFETRSHVIHIYLPKSYLERKLSDLRDFLGV